MTITQKKGTKEKKIRQRGKKQALRLNVTRRRDATADLNMKSALAFGGCDLAGTAICQAGAALLCRVEARRAICRPSRRIRQYLGRSQKTRCLASRAANRFPIFRYLRRSSFLSLSLFLSVWRRKIRYCRLDFLDSLVAQLCAFQYAQNGACSFFRARLHKAKQRQSERLS